MATGKLRHYACPKNRRCLRELQFDEVQFISGYCTVTYAVNISGCKLYGITYTRQKYFSNLRTRADFGMDFLKIPKAKSEKSQISRIWNFSE